MMIDKVGGIGPNYGPRKNEPVVKQDAPIKAGDNVVISAEAAKAAEVARTARTVLNSTDTERADRLKEIKEKVARGDYDNVSDEQANKIADSIMGVFLQG